MKQGRGAEYNLSAHVGYWFSPFKGLSFVLEPYLYSTRFKQVAVDVGRIKDKDPAWGGMFGSMYVF